MTLLSSRTWAVMDEVRDERARQEELKEGGKFEYTCADDGLTNAEKFTVLGEEVGEVARQVLTQPSRPLSHDSTGSRKKLRAELIQVAAVCVAWAEALS